MANALILFLLLASVVGSAFAGVFVHKSLYRRLSRKWLAFLVSLLGIFPLGSLLAAIGKALIARPVPGPLNFGQALGTGIAMGLMLVFFVAFGVMAYIVALIVAAIVCWARKRRAVQKQKA